MDIRCLYNEFKQTMAAEIDAMREVLGITHEQEYAILSGDEALNDRLMYAQLDANTTLWQIKTHRQQLLNQLASALNCSPALEDELWSTLQYYDLEDCEGSALIEQVLLLENKLEEQALRNESLTQAIDVNQTLPQNEMGIAYQPVYLSRSKPSVMITIDYPDTDDTM